MNLDAKWMNILARNISSIDFVIVLCIIGVIFFMRYDQKTEKNSGHKYIAICLAIGFLMIVGLRIYKEL